MPQLTRHAMHGIEHVDRENRPANDDKHEADAELDAGKPQHCKQNPLSTAGTAMSRRIIGCKYQQSKSERYIAIAIATPSRNETMRAAITRAECHDDVGGCNGRDAFCDACGGW